MEQSKIMSEFVKKNKADKRLANKKRKAEVLLNLLSQRQKARKSTGKEQAEASSSANVTEDCDSIEQSDVSPVKKTRLDNVQNSPVCKTENVTDEKLLKMLEKRRQKRLRLKEIRTKIKKIQKLNSSAQERPVFHLALEELLTQQLRSQPGPATQTQELPTLYMLDLQHLLTLGLLPNSYIYYPRWCKLTRPGRVVSVVVIVLDQLCASDLEEYQDCFPFMKKTFKLFAEVVSPYQYGSSVMKDIFRVPLSITTLKNKAWNKEVDRDVVKQQISEIRQLGGQTSTDVIQTPRDFNRKHLLLNPLQLMHEGYPMPIRTAQDRYRDFRFSFDSYKAVTKLSPMFAVDCEMCLTTAQENELARISVVNEKLETVYDTLVKPHNKIINYLTQYSGITKKMLDPVRTRLPEVQRKLRELLPSDSIWLGQSLNNDLVALKLFHPYVIDTSVIYNLSGFKWKKTGLKVLTAKFLKQDIQTGSEGHSSVEDARATMELVQLKLSKGVTFGDATLSVVESEPEEMEDSEVDNQCHKDEQVKHKSEKQESDTVEVQLESAGVKDELETSEQTEEENENEKKKQITPISQVFDKRRLFFQQQQGKYQSFFTLAMNGKKSAVVIDREDEISDIASNPGVESITATSDRARTQAAVSAVKGEDFVWVHLHAVGNRGDNTLEQKEGVKEESKTTNTDENKTTNVEENKTTDADGKEGTAQSDEDETELEEGEIKEDVQKKKCLKRLDKRVKKIVRSVRSKSLLCVVLSGQSVKDNVLNGGVLIKVT